MPCTASGDCKGDTVLRMAVFFEKLAEPLKAQADCLESGGCPFYHCMLIAPVTGFPTHGITCQACSCI